MDSKLYPQLTMRNKMRNTLSREKYIVLMQCISEYLSYFLGNLGENHATPKADGLFKMPQHGFFMGQPSPKWHPQNQKSCSKPGRPAYTTITDHKIHETRTGVQLLGMFVLNNHQPWLQHVATWFCMFYPLVNVYITMEHHHFLMGKSTISMAIFNSKLLVITRG